MIVSFKDGATEDNFISLRNLLIGMTEDGSTDKEAAKALYELLYRPPNVYHDPFMPSYMGRVLPRPDNGNPKWYIKDDPLKPLPVDDPNQENAAFDCLKRVFEGGYSYPSPI